LRNDIFTDYSPLTPTKTKPIYRMYQGLVMFDNLQLFTLDEFQFDIVVGHAPLNGLSSNPIMNIQISYDSGNTWGNLKACAVPKTGQYAGRVRWLRLGSTRGLVVRVSMTEDMQCQWGDARIRTRISSYP